MADRARVQRSRIALQRDELDLIVGLAAGRDGVRAVVARGAVEPAVLPGHSIERVVLIIGAAVVTAGIVAARLIEPGIRVSATWRIVP